jgi:hypothetical protein
MLTCSCDVLLLAGSSLYSAAGCTAVYITGLGRSLEKAWDLQQMGSSEAVGCAASWS